MTRIIQPKRDQEGTLYHFCPLVKENIDTDPCRVCPHMIQVEDLPTRYRVHCGYAEEGAIELIQFDIPKAHSSCKGFDKDETIKSPAHSWVEPKLDGARALVHCTPEGVFITSRRRNKEGDYNQFQDNVPHLRDHPTLVAFGKAGYTILDAELMMTEGKGGTLGSTMSVIGSKPERAIEVQEEHGKAVLYVFDMPRFKGTAIDDLELRDRRRILVEAFNVAPGSDDAAEHIKLVTIVIAETEGDKQILLDDALSAGYEGLVIKDPTSTYHDRRGWLKVKQHLSVDGLVTGWHHGNVGGKWETGLGDLAISVIDAATDELREICTVIPGDDETRIRLYEQLSPLSEEEILDLRMVVELEGQGWSQEYRIRHPRILRYRPDRSSPNTIDLTEVVRI